MALIVGSAGSTAMMTPWTSISMEGRLRNGHCGKEGGGIETIRQHGSSTISAIHLAGFLDGHFLC